MKRGPPHPQRRCHPHPGPQPARQPGPHPPRQPQPPPCQPPCQPPRQALADVGARLAAPNETTATITSVNFRNMPSSSDKLVPMSAIEGGACVLKP